MIYPYIPDKATVLLNPSCWCRSYVHRKHKDRTSLADFGIIRPATTSQVEQ